MRTPAIARGPDRSQVRFSVRRDHRWRRSRKAPDDTPPVPLLRALPAVLLCLTLTGAADAAASTGAVVGWGLDDSGQAAPPDDVNGVSGIAKQAYRLLQTRVMMSLE